MAHVLLVTSTSANATAASHLNTVAALQAYGHSVTTVLETAIPADLSPYDCVVTRRTSVTNRASVAAAIANKPLVVHLFDDGNGAFTNRTTAVLVASLGLAVASYNGSTSGQQNYYPIEPGWANHPITTGITYSTSVLTQSPTSGAGGYIPDADVSPHGLALSNAISGGRPALIVFEKGATLLTGGTAPERRVIAAHILIAGTTDYTADGALLLHRAVLWVTGAIGDARRISTAGAYAVLDTPTRRISTGGIYIVHGPNERRISTAGVYVVEGVPTTTAPTVSIDQSSAELLTGETVQLTATATGVPAPDLEWTSSDPAIATVSSGGLVTALLPGSVTITVTATNSAGLDTDEITVSIEAAPDRVAVLWDNAPRTGWFYVKNPRIITRQGFANPQPAPWPVYWVCDTVVGEAPLGPADVWMLGGRTNDMSLLAMLDLGSGKAFEASAEVGFTQTGRWVGNTYYYNSRSVKAGVGMGFDYGVLGEAPSWFGVTALLTPGSYLEHNAGDRRGYARARLQIAFLDYADTIYGAPSPYGYAGRNISTFDVGELRLYSATSMATYDAGLKGGRYWCSPQAPSMTECPTYGCSDSTYSAWQFNRVFLRVTEAAEPGYIRIQARVEGPDIAPPLGEWHFERVIGQPAEGPRTSLWPVRPLFLDCGWCGYAGQEQYDVSFFQNAWGIFRGFEATVLDPGDCNPPEPELYVPPAEEEVEIPQTITESIPVVAPAWIRLRRHCSEFTLTWSATAPEYSVWVSLAGGEFELLGITAARSFRWSAYDYIEPIEAVFRVVPLLTQGYAETVETEPRLVQRDQSLPCVAQECADCPPPARPVVTSSLWQSGCEDG